MYTFVKEKSIHDTIGKLKSSPLSVYLKRFTFGGPASSLINHLDWLLLDDISNVSVISDKVAGEAVQWRRQASAAKGAGVVSDAQGPGGGSGGDRAGKGLGQGEDELCDGAAPARLREQGHRRATTTAQGIYDDNKLVLIQSLVNTDPLNEGCRQGIIWGI